MNSDQYTEIEKKVLRTVLKKPDFARWASLCSLMSDGVYVASEIHDRDLPKRGWLHICARYLAIVPKRENRDKRLAPNEFYSKETSPYCDVFRPVVRSLRHYLETIYPNFDSRTGKWSRAGKEDKVENPFPFFIDYYLNPGDDEDDDVVTFSTLFEPIPEDCGDILRWTPEFNERLELMTDDYDAELEFGDFAGNVDEKEIEEIVKWLEKSGMEDVTQDELDIIAHMMVDSYNATIELHQSILLNRGKGRYAGDNFDRSSLFHPSCIQSVLCVFQHKFISEIERAGLKIQQYRSPICSAIEVANNVQIAWQSFFRELKRLFNGNPVIVAAESAGLSLVEHYASKISSEGGELHVPASVINNEYVAFVEKFEKVASVVAERDYAGVKMQGECSKKKEIDMAMAKADVTQVNIQNCQNVQLNSKHSSGVQKSCGKSKIGIVGWIMTVLGSVVAALVAKWIWNIYTT